MPGPLELLVLTVIGLLVFTPVIVVGVVVFLTLMNRKRK